MNTARLLTKDAGGVMHYAGATWPYFAAGEVIGGWPVYCMAGTGDAPALAVDGGGWRWIAYIDSDTLWVYDGENEPMLVFAGNGAAVPGQPSIACYPNPANNGYVANVVFAVAKPDADSSLVMYARVDTGQVILDTIESVAGLGDSLPSINVFRTDSLVATWQHSDTILSALLPDYGPGTAGQPGAWSTPNLVTANGYHPMSVMEADGVLNCVWTNRVGSNYAIGRATNNLAGGMFQSWTMSSSPSETSAAVKSNAVFAGLGCSVWEQVVGGKRVIRGKVRGDTVTLVASDTDAYQPHAVAESSAISPSIDQIRCHILYTAGVTFEVDSGVTDTGECRFKTCSLNVSHARSAATSSNNGSKLLRKADGDSLFCVYSDLDGAVMYASSADGDTWQREVMAQGRDLPAIAEDSSGRRWVVVHRVNQTTNTVTQEAYWRNSTGWSGPQTLYTNSQNRPLGPASLAGASDTTTGIAYAAFFVTGQSPALNRIVVVKLNGTNQHVDTLATGPKVTAPTLTVEPYKPDTDRIHVAWEDNGEIKYSMMKDARTSTISGTWTAPINLSNTNKPSLHPCIAADRHQVVLAWAEGDTADIYSRRRSTDSAYTNWESSANLSNTAGKVSEYPTIAMGDSVIVAWEEHRSTTDYDILISVNFTDTLNIADNSTKSSYPHVLFQTKDSTPYVHLVWCESPQTNYYEVQYNKCNLRLAGEGQQSAGKVPVPIRPSLAACRPNPFRDRTQIAYSLPIAGNVSLRVYDVTGRTVRTLQNGFQKPGAYSVNWDSKDSRGRLVPHGVYFYRLDTPGFRDVKKAVVAR